MLDEEREELQGQAVRNQLFTHFEQRWWEVLSGPRDLTLLLLWMPSCTSADQPLGPVSSLELVCGVPPQAITEGCAQELFLHTPFPDLNTYITEDNILLMIKTVTFNHFSDIYFLTS